jgi:catechol 2,3-dioxygenase-like lactoylglutathione lyase family enzyme
MTTSKQPLMRFHTSLPVRSIADTSAFYRVLFGAEPAKLKEDYAKFLPEAVALNISFHEHPDAVGALAGLHLGLEYSARTELAAAYERLERAGLSPTRRETSTCCYASQDKFWVTDPSGYRWELYYLVEDRPERIDPASSCCAERAEVAGPR